MQHRLGGAWHTTEGKREHFPLIPMGLLRSSPSKSLTQIRKFWSNAGRAGEGALGFSLSCWGSSHPLSGLVHSPAHPPAICPKIIHSHHPLQPSCTAPPGLRKWSSTGLDLMVGNQHASYPTLEMAWTCFIRHAPDTRNMVQVKPIKCWLRLHSWIVSS